MYKRIIRPFLFYFDPESVHGFIFLILKVTFKFPLIRSLIRRLYEVKHPDLERKFFGLRFKNPVGLAAGFDKNATHCQEFSCFGFGFLEIGTVTPKPQLGNPKKRLFRLEEDYAIINRMGFNNDGVHTVAKRLRKKRNILIGGNIGKNKTTLNEDAVEDYLTCFDTLFDVVDYFVINVSSPNTPNLRMLQEKGALEVNLIALQSRNELKPSPKPIFLKISPDLSDQQLIEIVSTIKFTGISGVIATNTTLSRSDLKSPQLLEIGGLSGKPLRDRSTEIVKLLSKEAKDEFIIIASGGIMTADDAIDKLKAGASLVQIYSGFIYEGPKLIRSINKAILKTF